VKDSSEVPARRLALALHSLQVQNELLHHDNEGLREALATKRKHAKKSKPLDLQQRKEYWGGVVFWSPRKLREVKARDAVEQQEKEEEKLRKADNKKLKEAALLYKKQQQKAAKELRESAAAARKKDADAKAAKRDAEKAQKQQKKDAAATKRSHDTVNRRKRAASQAPAVNKRSRGADAEGGSGAAAASMPACISAAATSTQDDYAGTANQPPTKF
jgi:hypothetical protein